MTTRTEKKFEALGLKDVSEDGVFEGYASRFGIVDQGKDMVMRGAYTGSLSRRPARGVKMLWQHDPSQPIGLWEEMKEDAEGLYVKGRLLTTVTRGKEAYELMKAGVIEGLSIGYRTIKASINKKGVRELKELDVIEVSLVTFPMLQEATATLVKDCITKRDVERVLRDAGMPNAMATKLIAGGWNAASADQGDPDDGPSLADTLRRMTETLQGRL